MKRLLTLIPVSLILISCATMKNGPQQYVMIETSDHKGATCDVSNKRGHWHVASTPAKIQVSRAASALTVVCHKGVSTGTISIKSTFQKQAILGGVSGMSVDVALGSAYNYPSVIKVSMTPVR